MEINLEEKAEQEREKKMLKREGRRMIKKRENEGTKEKRERRKETKLDFILVHNLIGKEKNKDYK